jgi:peptidoglycan/LPS O-acetylase OafA/YrhL
MSDSTAAPSRHSHRPDIEGLRAIAILLVVAYHAGVPLVRGGYVGVDVFFVVSGYLITSLLVREAEATGSVDLWRFYARRVRRLLPAIAAVLLACTAAGVLLYAPVEQRELASASFSAATYLSNVYFARGATDYLGPSAETHPLLHTWSLSVEEQFYLAWPLFVLLALGALGARRGALSRRRLAGWMAGAAALSLIGSVVLTRYHQPWAFFSSPARAWEFAAGGLAVLVPLRGWRGAAGSARGAAVQGWLGLGGIVAAALVFDADTVFPGVAALLPVLATVLVLRSAAAHPRCAPARALGVRPFQEIGRLSYSWYLWHWPVLVFAAVAVQDELGWPARLALTGLALAIAEASYRLVENPVRRSPRLTPAHAMAMAACLTLVGAGVSLAWRRAATEWSRSPVNARLERARDDLPAVYASGCHADFERVEADPAACTSGMAAASRTMVLFGDSHAAQWYPALEAMADERGWRLVSFTKSACPAVDRPTANRRLGREYRECAAWRRDALAEVRKLHPDLVVVASSDEYALSRTDWLHGTDRVLRSLSASSGAVAILRDTPRPGFDVAACVARRSWGVGALQWRRCEARMNGAGPDPVFQALRRAARPYRNAYVVDMGPYVCPRSPCLLYRDGVLLYRDTHHLTAEFAATLGDELVDLLKGRAHSLSIPWPAKGRLPAHDAALPRAPAAPPVRVPSPTGLS